MTQEEIRFKLLKLIETQPGLDQRALAQELGVSLGSVNFCIRAMVERGLVKAEGFKRSSNKRGYFYLLTAKGFQEKFEMTKLFLAQKKSEYAMIKKEIISLSAELNGLNMEHSE